MYSLRSNFFLAVGLLRRCCKNQCLIDSGPDAKTACICKYNPVIHFVATLDFVLTPKLLF